MDSQKISIQVDNCKSIKHGFFSIVPQKLNIKLGMNGTGKSTISEAIQKKMEDDSSFSEIKSFFSSEDEIPTITSSTTFKKVAVYNESFVNQIIFQGDDLIKDPFQIFITSSSYEDKKKELQTLTDHLKVFFNENSDGNQLIESFSKMNELISRTRDGRISMKSKIKVLENKYNYEKIPKKLSKYKPFFQMKESRVGWIDWKNKGIAAQYDQQKLCPFCANQLPNDYEEEKKDFSELYKKADAANLSLVSELFESCKDFITEDRFDELQQCIRDENLSQQSVEKIITDFYSDIDYLCQRFEMITSFDSSNFSIKEIDKIPDEVRSLIIEPVQLNYFRSQKSLDFLSSLNEEINKLIDQSSKLKVEMGKLKGLLLSAINKSEVDMNDFLSIAGFPYQVKIKAEQNENAVASLNYVNENGTDIPVTGIKTHLSWGERNAFGVVLFMYYACSQKADLIILDDPVSSFDSNKKYAIMHRLFERPPEGKENFKSLWGKTVLLLTHDYEPLIDSIIVKKLSGDKVFATYLENDKHIVKEEEIKQDDLIPTVKFLKRIARDSSIPKICRLSAARKYLEHTEDFDQNYKIGFAYNILSSCIHGLERPCEKTGDNQSVDLIPDEIKLGVDYISDLLADNFIYDDYLNECNSLEKLIDTFYSTPNFYLRLQVYRVMCLLIKEDPELKSRMAFVLSNEDLSKLVDESFHIENDYSFVLDYRKYHMIPSCFSDLIEKNVQKIRETFIRFKNKERVE